MPTITIPEWLKDQNGLDATTFDAEIRRETDKAILVGANGLEFWLPKSRIKVEGVKPVAAKQADIRVAYVDAGVIAIYTPFKLKDAIKATGARWEPASRYWYLPANANELRKLYELVRDTPLTLEDSDGVYTKLTKSLEHLTPGKDVRQSEGLPNIPYAKTNAWKHQRRAFAFICDKFGDKRHPNKAGVGLFFKMGQGKTFPAIGAILEYGFKRTLIVAPKSVLETSVWQKDAAKHFGKHGLTFVSLATGSTSKNIDLLNVHRLDVNPLVVLINYEALLGDGIEPVIRNYGFQLLIMDEIHRIKSAAGKTSRLLGELAKVIPYRLGLTGTPQPRSPLDVYAQYRALDRTVFNMNNQQFKQRYAVFGGYGGYQVLGYQNLSELAQRMYTVAYRPDEVEIELPEAVDTERTFNLSAKAQRAYNALADEFVAYINGKEVTASNTLVKLLRLQQITSGFLPLDKGNPDDPTELVRIDTGKMDLLTDVLEDLDEHEPVVVFCRFIKDLDDIKAACEKLGRTCGELSGRKRDIVAWQDGKYDVLAVQLQAGGVGIDLTRAHYCVYYSQSFNNGDYEQSRARVHRPGQKENVTYIHLRATNSIDMVIAKALEAKQELAKYVVDELRKGEKTNV